jgi:hypothetical protein
MTITLTREEAQQVLDALDEACEIVGNAWAWRDEKGRTAAEAIRARLAQPEQEQLMQDIVTYGTAVSQGGKRIDPTNIYKEPEQEPVALNCEYTKQLIEALYENSDPVSVDAANEFERLLTAPPQRREWVGLTDEEIIDMYNEPRSDAEMIAFGREVEAKLREKNND